jgi:hypothetical protein
MSRKTRSLVLASSFLLGAAFVSAPATASPRATSSLQRSPDRALVDAPTPKLAQKKGKKAKPAPAKKAPPVTPDERPAPSDPRTQAAPVDDSGGAAGPGGKRGPSRLEFDDRLVQGQTNKANAIYLFERRESALRSLLKKRTNFHDEIDETLQ